MVYAVLYQIADSSFYQIFIGIYDNSIQVTVGKPLNRIFTANIQVDEIYHYLPNNRNKINLRNMCGLHIIFQLWSKVEVVYEVFHSLALFNNNSSFLPFFFW